MIRPINIKLNAAHPELPLVEATTFTGAPSTVLIRGVPPNCGRWAITAVFVAASFPDGSTTTRAAVQSADGVWVATLPATATSGRTANGIRVMADGIDENGEAVTGYILGVADFAVASLDVTPAPEPGEMSYQMLYFDTVPATLRKGDVTKIDGVLKFYNGSAWEPFAAPVTLDDAVTRTSANGVKSSGIWSAIWGALSALPTGFASLYDWCVAQFTGKFAQYYPDGSVKSTTEFTQGIKYNAPDTVNRTITVKPFCNTGTAENDNSNLEGRVVIPPFVDAQGNGYISDDGTRFKVVGVSGGIPRVINTNLTAIIAPSTVTTIGDSAFDTCTALASVSLPAATDIGAGALAYCISLTSVSLPAATDIGMNSLDGCDALTSVSLPAARDIGINSFVGCAALTSIDFGETPRLSVPSLGHNAFFNVPTTCKIIVPYTQYDAWKAADVWKDLPQEFVRHAEKADKPATFTAGNLAKFDSQGNPTDSGKKPSDFQSALSAQQLANIAAVPGKLDKSGGTVAGSDDDQMGIILGRKDGYPYVEVTDGVSFIGFSGSTMSIVTQNGSYSLPLSSGNLARAADNPIEDNLAALDASGNPTDSGWTAGDLARYSLVTKTITNGAVSLDDRASNAVTVSAALSPNTLTINFPAATSGKVRDFAMRLNIAAGVTAPEIAWPQGVTLENDGGEVPEIADGGTGGSSTILYFSETENDGTTAKFLVKGETLTAITQA